MEELRRVVGERWQMLLAFCRERPRQAAEAGALSVLLCFAAALLLWDASSEEQLTLKQPPVETPSTAQKPNGPSRIEVKGSEEAEAGGELRNPFSMLHETRAEMAAASQSAKEATPQASEKDETANAKAAKQSALPAAKTSASAVEDMGAAEPQAPALVLKGVASGNGETVAVIRAEGKSKIVTEGENVGGYTVAAIDGDSVTLMGDGGTLVLQLAH
ncbi:MAG: hypothetical protein SPL39_09385 [Selenomonadaceae bacterium]|nr:hypothetical protein [Selenomonadaceae bacterium]